MKTLNNNYLKLLIGISLLVTILVLPSIQKDTDTSASAIEIRNTESKSISNKYAGLIYREKIHKIDSFLKRHEKSYYFQGNVLVGHKGQVIYKNSFGYANPKRKTDLDEHSVFQLASVSKQFTAAAVMILQQKGFINYSDTIQKFFPEFPYEGITIQMLLNHTSGLPNYMWLLEHKWNKERIPYNDDVIRLLNKHKLHLYFTPGTRFNYSNTGYVVLAAIIEKVSQMSYGDFLKQHIFEPLGMQNSFVYSPAIDKKPKEILSGYKIWGHRYRKIPYTINDGAVGDKGIYSTMNDLFKWDQALYSNKLLTEENKKRAFEPLTLKNGYHYPYGFGFRLKDMDSTKTVYHYGKWNGFRTGLIRFVEDSSTVVILNHTNRSGNSKITRNIKEILKSKES